MLVPPVSDFLLVSEFLVGILLLVGRGLGLAAAVGASMAMVFFLTTIVRLSQGASFECDCFGVFLKISPPIQLTLDVTLVFLCAAIFYNAHSPRKLD